MCKGMNRSFFSVILGGLAVRVMPQQHWAVRVATNPSNPAALMMPHLSGERILRYHRAGLRYGRGAGNSFAGTERHSQSEGCQSTLRHTSGGWSYAGAYERAVGGSQRGL